MWKCRCGPTAFPEFSIFNGNNRAIGNRQNFCSVTVKHLVRYLVRKWIRQDVAPRINFIKIAAKSLSDSNIPPSDGQN
jgi:hypothetical protein